MEETLNQNSPLNKYKDTSVSVDQLNLNSVEKPLMNYNATMSNFVKMMLLHPNNLTVSPSVNWNP
jgi:hypothetical protein